jgi:hypothetical protein
MQLIKTNEIFGDLEIIEISSKFNVSGALLKEKI